MATSNRDFDGVLHSAERLYLDKLWQGLGVDPLDERVQQLEGRLIRASLAHITEGFRELTKQYETRAGW